MDRAHPVDDLETTNRSITRAKTESFAFRLHDGDILAQPQTCEGASNQEHRVVIDGGVPVDCTCPAEAQYAPACKHRVAVAVRDGVLEAAVRMQVATDGGTASVDAVDDQPEPVEDPERPEECDCEALRDGVPCWPCYRDGRATFED